MSKPANMRVTAYTASDVGRVRQGNEDNAFAGTTTFAVADGMGGHVAGEVASETALQPVRELDGTVFRTDKLARQALAEAITAANRSVVDMADADPEYRGMGTTLTAAMLRDGKLHVAHVGDSRAYLLRGNDRLSQLTTDHTLVEQLVREGRLSPEEAATHPQRSVITRAIGIEEAVDIDVLPALSLEAGDQVLLCSDGLTGPVDDATITGLLTANPDGDAACQALIDAANDAGGPDNITVVLLRVEDTRADVAPDNAAAGATATGDTERLPRLPVASGDDSDAVTHIRTRHESGRDWATSMGRYGAPQGARRGATGHGNGHSRKLVVVLVTAAVLVGVLVAGGLFLLSRAWFVGEDDGRVAIYRGVPSEVAGLSLARAVERTDIPLDELPPHRAERLRQGITFGSYDDAEDYVDDVRERLEAEDERGAEPEDGADDGDAEPNAEPSS